MSNTTLQPASQNFLVEIKDACANPGTMCPSVISAGSHGISKLHVWVDWITLPFGSVIVIGFVAILMLTAGAPFIKKCPVAPESDIACLTQRVIFAASKIVVACGSWDRLFACIMCCHAFDFVVMSVRCSVGILVCPLFIVC